MPPRLPIVQLLLATRVMDAKRDPARTNEQAFAEVFFPGLGRDPAELKPVFDRFYRDAFPGLRSLTAPVAGALEAVRWAIGGGRQAVIATNPLFPRSAILQRMAWAGLTLDELPIALVTTYENMHATKVRPAYYEEIAERLGRRAAECVMVGDNWTWDIAHSTAAGMAAVVDRGAAGARTGGERAGRSREIRGSSPLGRSLLLRRPAHGRPGRGRRRCQGPLRGRCPRQCTGRDRGRARRRAGGGARGRAGAGAGGRRDCRAPRRGA